MRSFSGWSPRRLLTTASADPTSRSKSARPSGVLISSVTDFLRAVEGLQELAVVLAKEIGAERAGDVAADGGGLDFDHLGAEFGQQLRAVGSGGVLLHRDDANPR